MNARIGAVTYRYARRVRQGKQRSEFFPSTHGTWLRTQLATLGIGPTPTAIAMRTTDDVAEASRAAKPIRDHVIERYREPLVRYARAVGLVQRNEPQADSEDLVHDFLATRMRDATYMARWSHSGISLRKWLANGLILHARSTAALRARRGELLEDHARDVRAHAESNDSARQRAMCTFEAAWARQIVDRAQSRVRDDLAASDHASWWTLFDLRVLQQMPYAKACPIAGVEPKDAANVTRAVTKRLRAALISELADEGIARSHAEAELGVIAALLSAASDVAQRDDDATMR